MSIDSIENARSFTVRLLNDLLGTTESFSPITSLDRFNDIFQKLEQSSYQNIFKMHVLQPDTQILWQNEKNRSVFLLIGGDGEAQIFRDEIIRGQPQRIKQAVLSLPNIVGEISLITNGFALAHVIIKRGQVFALEIDINKFHKIFEALEYKENLLNIILYRSVINAKRVEYLSTKDVPSKLEQILKYAKNSLQLYILQGVIAYAKHCMSKENLFYMQHCVKNFYILEQFTENKSFLKNDTDLYIIIDGSAAIYKFSSSKEPIFMQVVSSGSLLGEMALFDEKHHHFANAVALTDTSLVGININGFALFLKEQQHLQTKIFELVIQRKALAGRKLKTTSRFTDLTHLFTPEVLKDINSVQRIVHKYNKTNFSGRPDLAWRVITSFSDGVITFDSNGKMLFINISYENAREMLGRFIVEELIDCQSRYELRSECLYKNAEIDTTRAYTKGVLSIRETIDTLENKIYYKTIIQEPTHWVSERLKFHEELINEWKNKVISGDKVIQSLKQEVGAPLIILASGNTGVGKGFLLNNISTICKRFKNTYINTEFVINPDYLKAKIREHGGYHEDGSSRINNNQAHFEGAELAEIVIQWAIQNTYNIIIDKRFLSMDEVYEILNLVAEKKYYIIMLDIDADLETSLDRVFGNTEKGIIGRDPDRMEAIPPYAMIEKGYYLAVNQRIARSTCSAIDEYYLFESDPIIKNSVTLFAERTSKYSSLNIFPGYFTVFYYATRDTQYDELISSCLENFSVMSRSSRGIIDTSATTNKFASLYQYEPELTKRIVFRNIRGILAWIFQYCDQNFTDANELRTFIEKIASEVNDGLLKPNVSLYRNANSTKYAYTKIESLESAIKNFCSQFYSKLQQQFYDPIEFAAWIEYRVDLCDHFFQDGCGRIAKILSAWILVRATGKATKFPKYQNRDEYYSHSPQSENEDVRSKKFTEWLQYYRGLFSNNELQ